MKSQRGCFLICFLVAVAAPASGQLDRSLAAHGGLEKWRSFAGVAHDLIWKSGKKGDKQEHQIFDLQNRSGLITSKEYTLGSSQGEVWIRPGIEALGGTPPRFSMWTPFYFFGMPFVLADPSAKQESLGKKTFRGQEYESVRITFAKRDRRHAG